MLTWLLARMALAGSVAIVVDGSPAPADLVDALNAELDQLDMGVEVEDGDVYAGESRLARMAEDLRRAVRDRRYEVVVALGPLASQAARTLRSPRVPVVAAVDLAEEPPPRGVFSLPLRLDVKRAIEVARLLADQEVAVVAPPALVDSGLLSARIQPATAGVDLAEDVGGLVVLPLGSMAPAERAALFEAWEARGLVTVALQGDLADGPSATLSTEQGIRSVLRRIALVLSDLRDGRQPSRSSVVLRANALAISIPALRRLDRQAPFALIAEAELVGVEEVRERIDLDTAMDEAFRNSPSLGSIRADLRARDTAVASAVASWLPSVDVAVRAGFTDPSAVSPLQPATSVTGALTAEQLAFSDGAVVNLNVQQDLRRARNAEWSAAEQELVYDVASAYVGLIRAYAVLDVRRADLDRVRESLQVARDRQAVGDVAATEVARWESEFASAEASLVVAFNDVQQVQIGLNQRLGADPSRPLQPEPLREIVQSVPGDLTSPRQAQRIAEALAAFAQTQAPELEQLDHLVRSQRRLSRLQRRQYWMPTVAGSFTVNGNFFLSNVDGGGGGGTTPTPTGLPGAFDPSAFIVDPPLLTWQAGVSASLPLFAGGGRRASQLEAERTLRSVEEQRETLRQALVARSRDGVNQLFASALRAQLGEVQVSAVQRTLNAAIDAYARGATTQTTVTEARTSALSAELGATNATYDVVQAVFDVLFVAGALPTPSSPNGPAELRAALTVALEAP